MITKFTSQQQDLITSYQQKWRAISLSTERIDRKRALAVLEDVYNLYPEGHIMPEVIFFESPYAAFSAELIVATGNYNGLTDIEVSNQVASLQTLCGEGQVRSDLLWDLEANLSPTGLNPQISKEVWQILKKNLVDEVGSTIHEQLWEILWNWLNEKLCYELKDTPDAHTSFYENFIYSDSEWASYPGLLDFCINELNYQHDQEQWNVYQAVCIECGWWFIPTPTHYIICDRPTKLLLDDQDKLHADEEPAIQFADGFALYARHGEIYSTCFP
ncbi:MULTISPECIES: DUF6745 domain-containing protein [Nostoc]|uniref:DUF6745 domain-containing protein n=1 Tax=Nostoc paludosum FACHB-159 TaxID=2692908 RepID=A0ABR8KH82_9NOSO|nr:MULTISPECIES: hypothetical protein [Nostoc]MBD2682551.1 hypothetical protein [Nostoc sp. FACHB-857]MBD2738883.1 hypothetical protein [Nostoc paludosum FACHB-159]